MPTGPVRICVIFNPTARGDRARRWTSKLEGLSDSCELLPTTGPGGGIELGRRAVEEGFGKIVAAGGDGTINEVINGIAQAKGLENARLGVLPWGSVNVFAKELELPTKFEKAWEVIAGTHERVVDLGWMEMGKEKERRCFVQLAGAGLDGRAVDLVDWERKKRLGGCWVYLLAGWEALGEDLPEILVKTEDQELSGQLVMLSGGRFYGGRYAFFPDARMDDGLLDVVVVKEIRRSRILKYGWAVLRDKITSMSGVDYLQAKQVELTSKGRVPVETDGDAAGELPAKVTVQPKALRVLVP